VYTQDRGEKAQKPKKKKGGKSVIYRKDLWVAGKKSLTDPRGGDSFATPDQKITKGWEKVKGEGKKDIPRGLAAKKCGVGDPVHMGWPKKRGAKWYQLRKGKCQGFHVLGGHIQLREIERTKRREPQIE